jgi:hypothetical protein
MSGEADAVTITRSPAGVPADVAREYERVVRDVLAGEGGPLEVQFGTWIAEDGRVQVVCRVEAPPADPFRFEMQWRWWSPLLDSPGALREELGAAVSRRRGARTRQEDASSTASSASAGTS